MLILSEQDINKIVALDDVLEAVESAFRLYEEKLFSMPNRMHAHYRGNTLLLMPCFTEKVFSTKLVSLFPGNASQHLPVLYGAVMLNHGNTGKPMALLNGSSLTAYRTGAVGGLGVRYLAPDNAKSVGVIGCGVQGYSQVIFACSQRDITDVFLYDFSQAKMKELAEKLHFVLPEVAVHLASSSSELADRSDIIITATNAEKPVFPDETSLLQGKTCIGIGSYKPSMREFPRSFFRLPDQVFIDNDFAVEESGDLIDPIQNGWIRKNQIHPFGRIITGEVSPDRSEGATRFFKSVGMALFDLTVSQKLYHRALEKGIGRDIAF